jgi:hypothetical protein
LIASPVSAQEAKPEEKKEEEKKPEEKKSEEAPTQGRSGLIIHFVSTQGTYAPIEYDVYSVETGKVVAKGRGADEARNENPTHHDLQPGLYKIVRTGQPFQTKIDFVTAAIEEGAVTDFVVIVDPQTGGFRGGGPVTDELPEGVELFGLRVALNGGGSLLLNHKVNPIGRTSGVTALVGLFGHFGLVFDRNRHFLDISSDLQLNFTDQPTGKAFSTTDQFDGSATYTFKLNNVLGPYVRGGFRTRIFPGYLYLESENAVINVNTTRLDGTMQSTTLGTFASPDDLRLKLSDVFSPFILHEEIGVNLKAVDVDLYLLQLVIGTRLGFGLRQGIINDLFVVDGSEDALVVQLREVDDYDTLGPVVGASAKVTFLRWLFGQANFSMMAPLSDKELAGDDFGHRLLIDFSGTAGVKIPALTDFLFASFDYTFRLERDGFITRETQFDHSLMARLNVTLF